VANLPGLYSDSNDRVMHGRIDCGGSSRINDVICHYEQHDRVRMVI
jgi:hypothetical protein